MAYDLKNKIELHGKVLKRNAVLSIVWMIFAYLLMAYIFLGRIDAFIIGMLVLYGGATSYAAYRRIQTEKKFYNFKPGNPTYDYLAEMGEPEKILEEINADIKDGIIYGDLRPPKSDASETIMTKNWFLHLDRVATVIPLEKIICAYIYERQSNETPDERTRPSYFKPLYLVITYGKDKEAIMKHSSLRYKEALKALDTALGCKINYTRELKTLYETDYDTFVEKVREIREKQKAQSE